MMPGPSTRVVNRGNLAVSLLTLLVAFLVSLYSLSPSGRHLLFGRATTTDEFEASPLELFLTESHLHDWPSWKEPYFVLNRADLVRVRLPGRASNFSVTVHSIGGLEYTSSALASFFGPTEASSQVPTLSALYRHGFLRGRFRDAEKVPTGTPVKAEEDPLRALVICETSTACPIATALLAFQRLSRREATRPLALFAMVLGASTGVSDAVEKELRANGLFTMLQPIKSDRTPTLVGSLPANLTGTPGEVAPGTAHGDARLYRVPAQRKGLSSSSSASGASYQLLQQGNTSAGMQEVSVTPFSSVIFGRQQSLNATTFDVVHVDVSCELSVAAVVYLAALLDGPSHSTAKPLPRSLVIPLCVSEWATHLLDTVAALNARRGYHLAVLGDSNVTTNGTSRVLAHLREEVRQRAEPALRTYWQRGPPLYHLVLSQNPLGPLFAAVPTSALTATTLESRAAAFFTAPHNATTGGGGVTDVYPFNDGLATQQANEDVAGRVGGVLYAYLAVIIPVVMYSVPLIICVVILRNLSKRWRRSR